ncbi:hypothetical protein [Tsukamurella soli]|uniref:Universal stress protein family protein n=1 Tax=Tsukamurella soli TaxID=644556 RepID=A0ABP8JT46_9ACTN
MAAEDGLNGIGAALSALAGVVFFLEKFAEGAWLLLVIIPLLIANFAWVQRYYRGVADQTGLGRIPAKPSRPDTADTVVVVPVAAVSNVARAALTRAAELGSTVIPVAVDIDSAVTHQLSLDWEEWDPGYDLTVLPSPHRQLIGPTVGYVRKLSDQGKNVTVLMVRTEPRRRIYRLMHNPRAAVFSGALKERTDATIATMVVRL